MTKEEKFLAVALATQRQQLEKLRDLPVVTTADHERWLAVDQRLRELDEEKAALLITNDRREAVTKNAREQHAAQRAKERSDIKAEWEGLRKTCASDAEADCLTAQIPRFADRQMTAEAVKKRRQRDAERKIFWGTEGQSL